MAATQLVQVRLVETLWSNSLEPEDGPGSLLNVVSTPAKRYYTLGKMAIEDAKAVDETRIWHSLGLRFKTDSPDGFEEYGYTVEYFDLASDTWRFARNFF